MKQWLIELLSHCQEDSACWVWQEMGNQLAHGRFTGRHLDTIVRAFDTVRSVAT